ncbi:MAG: hypothetical protein FJ246_03455 [Nitrospira sp.]|nr:hypothetical protein [Nitrospira sp.]
MPTENNFQHATYSRSDPGDRVVYRDFVSGAQPDSLAWQDEMARLGSELSQGGVRAVLFMQGAGLGADLFGAQRLDEAGGLKRGYSRGIPGMEALLALLRQDTNGLASLPDSPKPPLTDDDATRNLLDKQVGDRGNFTNAYVELFRNAVNRNASRPIVCSRHLWSSEQHHLGRALAAWHLLERLRTICAEQKLGAGDRLLVQAHGHAGQVLALVSNLLAPNPSSGREAYFQILKAYYEKTKAAPDALPRLLQIENAIQAGTILNGAALDIVTFGTPIRYGWDAAGLGKLLHVVNHRMMRTDGKRWLAKMDLPQVTMEMPLVWGGDYVQQLAVAGSDAATPTSPEGKTANKALWELLEPWDGFERWLECARKSVRCPADGQCLLVDYKDASSSDAGNPRDHLYGHAAYTRTNALFFNTAELVLTLYAHCVAS